MHWKKLPVRFASALAQALLVHVELLARLRGDRLRHRDRLEQPEQRDRERARREVADRAPRRARATRRPGAARGSRRPPRRRAGRGRARRPEPPSRSPTSSRSGSEPQAEAPLRASAARAPARSCRARSPAVSAWSPPPSTERAARSGRGSGRGRRRRRACPSRFLSWSSTSRRAGAEREADDDRVRDVAGEIAEPEQRDAELDHADHEGEQDRGLRPSRLGPATGAITLSTAIEIALVGPLMSWRDESKSAPTAVITIAV